MYLSTGRPKPTLVVAPGEGVIDVTATVPVTGRYDMAQTFSSYSVD